jgi:hypothetical protein
MARFQGKVVSAESLGLTAGEVLDLIWPHWQWPVEEDISRCWIWGGRHHHLLPVVVVKPRVAIDVRRELYLLEHGTLPSRISMTCNTVSCVRPHHAS